MDDQYKSTIRKVTTISMIFSETGGFMSVVFLIAIIAVKNAQIFFYNTSLMKSFYMES